MPGEGIVGVVVYHALRLGSISSNLRPYIAALGVRLEFRRRGIATRLKESAMLDMAEHGLEGPTVSLVNRRNVAMQQLNATRFHAVVDRYPDDEKYDLVTVAIELED
jgi:GNAT superfamily N-acetyltransferase